MPKGVDLPRHSRDHVEGVADEAQASRHLSDHVSVVSCCLVVHAPATVAAARAVQGMHHSMKCCIVVVVGVRLSYSERTSMRLDVRYIMCPRRIDVDAVPHQGSLASAAAAHRALT